VAAFLVCAVAVPRSATGAACADWECFLGWVCCLCASFQALQFSLAVWCISGMELRGVCVFMRRGLFPVSQLLQGSR